MANENEKLENNLEILARFAKYEDNWNGYDAEKFKPDFINKVKEIIKTLNVQPEIFPVADKSVQLEYSDRKKYLEIQIYENDLASIYFVSETGSEEEYEEKEITSEKINEIYKEKFVV